MSSAFDQRQLRTLFGCFATGITVVTLRQPDGQLRGITVNSFASVSLAPPLVLFCLGRTVNILRTLRRARHFAINILAEDQAPLSRHFAAREQPPLPDTALDPDVLDCPILRGTLGWMVCRPVKFSKAGDHVVVLGEIEQHQQNGTTANPLLYFRSGYQQL
jgi:flavin reductase (DIM6/NTAB) family NADH-FMN oxidoreductase RutF